MRNLDFSSLRALVTTLFSLAVITLLGVGIRLMTQMTIQQRRERLNRQINERLRALIAAYKTLGGSFTGDLTVNPAHRRALHYDEKSAASESTASLDVRSTEIPDAPGADRARRIRDAVEAALSDIILLGTEEQVRLAAKAARELVNGRLVHTEELVVSLRNFIREALDLEAIPTEVVIPQQGPAREVANSSKGKSDKADGRQGSGSGMSGSGGFGGGGGMGSGLGLGSESHRAQEEDDNDLSSTEHHG